MPRKSKGKSKSGDDSGSLRSALGGFFGGTAGRDAGQNMFGVPSGGGQNMFGSMFGGKQEIVPQEKPEPFGKASALAAADDDDDDDDDSPMNTPQKGTKLGASGGLQLPSAEQAAAHAEEARRKKEAAEAAEAAEKQARERAAEEARKEAEATAREEAEERERKQAEARKAEEAARKKQAEEQAEAKNKRDAEEAAAHLKAEKEAAAAKLKADNERKQRELQASQAEQKEAQRATGLMKVAKKSAAGGALTQQDKINDLLLQHSSKWEVRVSVGDVMAASWVSHVQARTLMQQLRLRLLLTPHGWLPSERPDLPTVLASGLSELGALETENRLAFLAAQGKGCQLLVQVLVHETEKAGAPALTAMELEAEVSSARGRILGEALSRLRNVHASKKSVASSWGAAARSKDAQLERSVGTMSAMLTAGLFSWDRLAEE